MTPVELQLSSSELVTFGLLTAALVSLWLPPRWTGAVRPEPWLTLLLAAIASALVSGFIAWPGLLALVVLGLVCRFAASPTTTNAARTAAEWILILLVLALAAHQVPGFSNPKVIDSAILSEGGVPYSKYLNFDKAAAGLLLVVLGRQRVRRWREWADTLRRAAPVSFALAAVIMPLSYLLGYVRWDPRWSSILPFWAWSNLFFTCIAEEAIFRGFIQRRLTTALAGRRFGSGIALVVAAILFGLAHYAGGPKYVVLSTVGGLGYGWAWLRTDRIESSIAVHFFVNLVHFSLFTYPALAPTLD